MGDHLIKLGEEEDKKKMKEVLPPAAPPVIQTVEEAEEQRRINEILSNPKLREILEDPKMKEVLTECQQPGKLMYYFNHPVFGPKLKIMQEAGLVQIHN